MLNQIIRTHINLVFNTWLLCSASHQEPRTLPGLSIQSKDAAGDLWWPEWLKRCQSAKLCINSYFTEKVKFSGRSHKLWLVNDQLAEATRGHQQALAFRLILVVQTSKFMDSVGLCLDKRHETQPDSYVKKKKKSLCKELQKDCITLSHTWFAFSVWLWIALKICVFIFTISQHQNKTKSNYYNQYHK